jgi:ubiquinone/menaquinone biosynthesis C-methylase UbiE
MESQQAAAIICFHAMSWFQLPRQPEPEVMDDACEVEAYASAAAQAHLDAIDNTLVEQVLALGIQPGMALDVGTGPGSIPLKLARRRPDLHWVGIDKSQTMLGVARRAAREQGLNNQVSFCLADAGRLCFPDAVFDLVLSNSLLHHLADPIAAFNEMARVTKPDGVVLIRDLRRPSRLAFKAHVAWHGRHYSGKMKELYDHSVRAAYTPAELQSLIEKSALASARIFLHRRTHLGAWWKNVVHRSN